MPRKLSIIVGAFLLYLFSTGVSFAAFRYLNQNGNGPLSPVSVEEGRDKLDLSAPKTEACPLNGGMFTETERQIWEGRRPAAVIIENHAESRPASGLAHADIVYEAVAEGGITRFLGIFYCAAAADDVKLAPVRSARIYFINWASEYGKNPIFTHVGGANDFQHTGDTVKEARALELLGDIGWRYKGGNDFDATYDLGAPVFLRNESRLDHAVAVEHTMTSSTDKIWAEAAKRGLNNQDKAGNAWNSSFVPWKFKDDAAADKRGTTASIKLSFFGDFDEYKVEWTYDQTNNLYKRSNGGQPHLDLNTGQPLSAKNVAVLFIKERASVDRNKHFLYENIGRGDALLFQDGQAVIAKWEKTKRESRTILYDQKGKEISFNRGPIWFETVAVGATVDY